jgi:SagB-type dehydrogenase family enzyme
VTDQGRATRLRLHPALLGYPRSIGDQRHFVLEVSADDPPWVTRRPEVFYALSVLPETFTKSEALALWQAEEELAPTAVQLWESLLAAGVFVPASAATSETLERAQSWWRYGWSEAFTYHEATRDYPFLEMTGQSAVNADRERMVEYASEAPPPCTSLAFSPIRSVPLRKLHHGESTDALVSQLSSLDRRGLTGLAVLLDICFGERGRVSFPSQGTFFLKSIPSGGARHPAEAFLAVFDCDGIAAGTYHYNVELHALDLIDSTSRTDEWRHATYDLWARGVRAPFALLVIATVWERAMWRYRDARSWRAPIFDVGHIVMAFRTTCRVLGIDFYTYHKFRDTLIARLLGVDMYRVTPVTVATLM